MKAAKAKERSQARRFLATFERGMTLGTDWAVNLAKPLSGDTAVSLTAAATRRLHRNKFHRSWLQLAGNFAKQMGKLAATDANRERMYSLERRIACFHLFESAPRRLGYEANQDLISAAQHGLAEPVAHAAWSLEGLGRAWGQKVLQGDESPWQAIQREGLPLRALIPLHVGLGVALGEGVALNMGQTMDQNSLKQAINHWQARCRHICLPGYEYMVRESLGLVLLQLRPEIVAPVAKYLMEQNPSQGALFWHGLGRGLYFWPGLALPMGDSAQRALERMSALIPEASSFRAALSGYGWAEALVNLDRPSVSATSVACLTDGGERDAYGEGIARGLALWTLCGLRDSRVDHFLAYDHPWWRDTLIPTMRHVLGRLADLMKASRLDHLFLPLTGNKKSRPNP